MSEKNNGTFLSREHSFNRCHIYLACWVVKQMLDIDSRRSRYNLQDQLQCARSMATYLVTGANRGIGYEYCRQLQARGESAIAVCRQATTELTALGIRVEANIDVTSDAAVADLNQRLGDTQIDVLINNAAIAKSIPLEHPKLI
jgi:FlaA1/EpsC-like NDP-sugar epimerase